MQILAIRDHLNPYFFGWGGAGRGAGAAGWRGPGPAPAPFGEMSGWRTPTLRCSTTGWRGPILSKIFLSSLTIVSMWVRHLGMQGAEPRANAVQHHQISPLDCAALGSPVKGTVKEPVGDYGHGLQRGR